MEIKNIEKFIINNKLTEALNELGKIFEKFNDEELLNESILILSRLNNFKRKSNQGVIDYFDPEFGKIRLSVINLKSSAKTITLSKKNSKNISSNINPQKLILDENFRDNSNGWNLRQGSELISTIKTNRFYNENLTNDNAFNKTIDLEINENKNFSIKSRFTILGQNEAYGVGLVWGSSDVHNYFRFFISPNGKFIIDQFIDAQKINFTNWVENPIIKIGKKINVLEIIGNRDNLHFKINSEVVHTTEMTSFFGNRIGFCIGSNTKVAIDYLRIKN